jgi:hypothetical protein
MKHKRKKFDGLNDLILFLSDKIKKRMSLRMASVLMGRDIGCIAQLRWRANKRQVRNISMSLLMDTVNLAHYNIFLVPKDMDDEKRGSVRINQRPQMGIKRPSTDGRRLK